MVSSMVTVVE